MTQQNLFGKKQGVAFVKKKSLTWVQQWVKKGLEIKAAITVPRKL
jgi:hypothetical protein